MTEALSRRGALRGSLLVVAGGVAGFLSARAGARAPRGTTAANAYGPAPASSGRLLVALDKVPRSGGLVLQGPAIVLTRTAAGDLHAFSAVCTHQGCTVATVANGTIDCPCHGSRFDATTGSVQAGPASRALPPVAVTVRSGNVYSS